MEIKEALFNEFLSISKFAGKIDASNIFWNSRGRENVDFPPNKQSPTKKIQIIYFPIGEDEDNSTRNTTKRIEMHVIGNREYDIDTTVAAGIIRDHFHGFTGILGELIAPGGPNCHQVRFEAGSERYDPDTEESFSVLVFSFSYIKQNEGDLNI